MLRKVIRYIHTYTYMYLLHRDNLIWNFIPCTTHHTHTGTCQNMFSQRKRATHDEHLSSWNNNPMTPESRHFSLISLSLPMILPMTTIKCDAMPSNVQWNNQSDIIRIYTYIYCLLNTVHCSDVIRQFVGTHFEMDFCPKRWWMPMRYAASGIIDTSETETVTSSSSSSNTFCIEYELRRIWRTPTTSVHH